MNSQVALTANESRETLFQLEDYSSTPVPTTERPEEPWLEPVWKDDGGAFHYAEFGLLYRYFARTLIHEAVFWYRGQHDIPRWWTQVCGDYSSGVYYQDRLQQFVRDGFPEPQPGGLMRRLETTSSGREIERVLIFCDDLFLCPRCATYHPYRRHLPPFDWLRSDDIIDHTTVRKLIEARRSVPEFELRLCGKNGCADIRKRTLEWMKQEEDVKSRVNALNALLKRRTTTNAFPIRRAARAGFVYAIKADVYVKIGVATDVQSRVLALRTGLPFEITIINTWKHSNATRAERALHRRFETARCSGEWFRLSDDDIDLLRRTKYVDELISD